MRAVKSVSIDSERRVVITFLDGSTETLYPNLIWCDAEALKEIIKDLLEEKADAVVQTINNVTVATFEDGADEALVRKLLVSIEPIQEGTGDPTPENVRQIVGRTELSVTRTGKNLLPPVETQTIGGITYSQDGDYIDVTGTRTGGSYYYFINKVILPAGNYTINGHPNASNETFRLGVKIGDESYAYTTIKARTYTSDGVTPWIVALFVYTSYDHLKLQYQLEAGSAATEYEAYKKKTYTVNWESEAGEVYGGTLDVVSGKLTVDRGYIASYNGEALPSTWISDRDVYAEGTTPTIGAQVVYKLATPTVILLTPQEATTLLGDNTIWVDSGDILELEYVADTKLYIGESQSGTLGSGRQTISKPDLQPISEKVTQEETEDERGE